MTDELVFRRHADEAIESPTQSLFDAEEAIGFEVEQQNEVLNIEFSDPISKLARPIGEQLGIDRVTMP